MTKYHLLRAYTLGNVQVICITSEIMMNQFLIPKNEITHEIIAGDLHINGSANFDQFLKSIYERLPNNTQKAMRSDWRCYERFIKANELAITSADENVMFNTMTAYVDYLSKKFTIKTIRRRLHHIKVILSYLGGTNPLMTSHQLKKSISLTIKKVAKPAGQALPLTNDILAIKTEQANLDNPIELRNIMIINLAYDSLCRTAELRMIKVGHISKDSDGSGTVFIERTKSDREAVGAYRFVSATTMALIEKWIENMKLKSTDFLICAMTSAGTRKPYLGYDSRPAASYEVIVSAFKAAQVSLTGHSARVGAVLDMVKAEISITKIQLAGGWRDQAMPLLYSRKIRAKNSAAAEMAKIMRR